jgi:hypothetical protein
MRPFCRKIKIIQNGRVFPPPPRGLLRTLMEHELVGLGATLSGTRVIVLHHVFRPDNMGPILEVSAGRGAPALSALLLPPPPGLPWPRSCWGHPQCR